MHEDTTRFSGVEFQLQATKDAISHSPQASAWSWSHSQKDPTVSTALQLKRRNLAVILETVKRFMVVHGLLPRLKPGENERASRW